MMDRYVVVSTDERSHGSRYVRGEDGEPFQGTLEQARAFIAEQWGDLSDEPPTFVVFAVQVGGSRQQIELARGTKQ